MKNITRILLTISLLLILSACGSKPNPVIDIELQDQTLIITYSDGTKDTVPFPNLETENGLSAFELYKKYHPNYSKEEDAWLNDLINLKLSDTDTYDVFTKQDIIHGITLGYTSFKLQQSLVLEDGYIIEDEIETINLNGYTIFGTLSIHLETTNLTIENGSLEGVLNLLKANEISVNLNGQYLLNTYEVDHLIIGHDFDGTINLYGETIINSLSNEGIDIINHSEHTVTLSGHIKSYESYQSHTLIVTDFSIVHELFLHPDVHIILDKYPTALIVTINAMDRITFYNQNNQTTTPSIIGDYHYQPLTSTNLVIEFIAPNHQNIINILVNSVLIHQEYYEVNGQYLVISNNILDQIAGEPFVIEILFNDDYILVFNVEIV